MPIISWGLSRYPYYDSKSFCNIICENLAVLFCCQADYSDDEEDDDDDYDTTQSTSSSPNDYVRGANKTD
jgi:hypothetical protein